MNTFLIFFKVWEYLEMKSFKLLILCIFQIAVFVFGGLFVLYFTNENFDFNIFKKGSGSVELSQEVSATKDIDYKNYTTSLYLRANNILAKEPNLNELQKDKIQTLFSKINERAKQEKICQKGGSFTLSPSYDYKDGQQVQKGHSIEGAIVCELTKEDEQTYKNLVKDLDYLVLKSGLAKLWGRGITPIVTEQEQAQVKQDLFDEIVKKSKDLQKHYEDLLDARCKIANINLDANNVHSPVLRMAKAESSVDYGNDSNGFVSFDFPIQGSTTLKSSALITMKCK